VKTQRIAEIRLVVDELASDLKRLQEMRLSTAYSNYICGGPWLSCMVWALGGETGDGVLTHYEGRGSANWTRQSEQLPAVRALIEASFSTQKLKFARLGMLQPGSVIIPHRDLLELDAPLHRLHIPLQTDENCMFTERNIVYRMRPGEVWFLDASDVHSVACFSTRNRVHLILDFGEDATAEDIFAIKYTLPGDISQDCVLRRQPMTQAERQSLLGLSSVLNERNWRTVLDLVIRQHFRCDGGNGFVWETMLEIAANASDRAAAAIVHEMHHYYLMERSGSE